MDTNINPNPSSDPTPPPSSPSSPGRPGGGPVPNNGMAILAYLGILIIVPFVTEAHKDPYVKFHLKQGLALLIMEVAAVVLGMIPILGWIASFFLWIAAMIFIILGIINAATGKMKELPIIGKFAHNFNF